LGRRLVCLPACPSARPACTRAPRKPRTVPPPHPLPAPTAGLRTLSDRPSIQATPVLTHRDSPILIYRLFSRLLFVAGKLQCVCTTPECDREGTSACRADNFCYVQVIPPVSASVPAVASTSARRSGAVTRGCIDDDTPLLCENKRPSTYRGAWPVLHCCSHDWCNHNVLPTFPPWASHVEGDLKGF